MHNTCSAHTTPEDCGWINTPTKDKTQRILSFASSIVCVVFFIQRCILIFVLYIANSGMVLSGIRRLAYVDF